MTIPRGEIFIAEKPHFYHCWSRCVRRAFLCGFDVLTGKSFEHRRAWVELRLKYLVSIFAVELAAYAVMSNHLHSVVRNRPDIAKSWSPEEVARRWRLLFPKRRNKNGSPCDPSAEEIQAIAGQPRLVKAYRQRLSSISWFHRCLNENIARRANKEDECTGRFWEGRFRSERLDTTAAVIACSVYVDLNPIRAGLANSLEKSSFTSIKARVYRKVERRTIQSAPHLLAVADFSEDQLSEAEYLKLVHDTGYLVRQGKGSIAGDTAPILNRLGIKPQYWLEMNKNKPRLFRRVIGSVSALRKAAKSMGKNWLHGIKSARLVFG